MARTPKAAAPPPRLEVVYRPLASLVPYAKNARKHSPTQIKKIKASLQEFGWANVMLVADNEMIAGHARLAAALELNAEGAAIPHTTHQAEGPTIDLSHLTKAQRRAYVLADNRLAEEASWDSDLLKGEFADLMSLAGGGFDLGLAGFDPGEINTVLHGWQPDFTTHDKTPANLDPLIALMRLRYLRKDHVDISARVAAVLAEFEQASIDP